MKVRITLDNARGLLRPGMFATVHVATGGGSAALCCVPAKAIVFDGGVDYVVKELKGYGLPDKVLTVEISKLTDEEKADLLKKNEEIRKELEYIKSTEIKDMYLDDLKKLKKELEGDFKG